MSQTTKCFDDPHYIHKCLDSEPSTFLLFNRYSIFNKFDKDIQLHMIMIFTPVPYLAKGPRPDINNGPGGDSNGAHILAHAFFQIQLNNGPFPGHSNLGSDGRYTCSSLLFMDWWVPYLNKSPRPDFNNASEMT